jgi:very-short-patch-repair endonuclease
MFVEFGLIVELDGQEAHPTGDAFRDRRRDNQVTVSGRRTLRYGWREVSQDPCGVAAEVAAVLTILGWTGNPHPCGPRCTLTVETRS